MTTMKAHQLIDTPNKWTKTKSWHLKNGNNPTQEHSNKWCVATAILKCYPIENEEILVIFQKLEDNIGMSNLAKWNDTNNHQTIYNTLKKLDI